MDLTPGRAKFNPDETVKPLRLPKSLRLPDGQHTTTSTEQQQPIKTLSATAKEFVPRFVGVSGGATALQERLQRHQQQHIQENYHNYQHSQQQYNEQQTYFNGYGQSQQPQQQQLVTQINSMHIGGGGGGGVQERLHTANNSRGSSNAGNGSIGVSCDDGYTYFYSQNKPYHNRSNYNKNYHNNHHNNHHQPRYNNHNNYHSQHRHNHYNNQTHQENSNQESQSDQKAASSSTNSDGLAAADDMQNIALDYLQTVMQCLNENPGQFDTIAPHFINIFDGMENNHYVLSIAMEDLFKESIQNPNFRYMGAKLYCLLHLLNPRSDSLFNTFLKYKLDFHQQDMKHYMEKHQENKVRETALFLAELYMQLRIGESRIILIAENIVYSLKQLLKHVSNENMRCICLTLKLAGYDLSTDCKEDMKEIIASLEKVNSENPGKYPLASNVIALQKNNWGRKASGSESLGEPESSAQPEQLRASDDPVFYGPDGREITAEECEFLTKGAGGGSNNGGGSTDNEDIDLDELDPEMDEETERDYKLFLMQAASKS